MTSQYTHELQIAQLAVQKAVLVTRTVLSTTERGELSKSDNSPVSLADFAAQALLVAAIHTQFPADTIVGEEDASALRANTTLAKQVWQLVESTHLEDAGCEALVRSPASLDKMLDFIDLGGKSQGGGHGRVWIFDPIDGTKGFLDGGQYVVCAAFLEGGVQKVAAFGAPHVNLSQGRISEADTDKAGPGYLISAVKGGGTYVRPLSKGALLEARKVEKRSDVSDLSTLRFAENRTSTTPLFPGRGKIAEAIGAPWDLIHIFSTQLRYLALALGTCDAVLRVPWPGDVSHVWDHAGGGLVFFETGGKVTDLNGKELDFTIGRDLTGNFGLIAATEGVHGRLLEAARDVLTGHEEYKGVVRMD